MRLSNVLRQSLLLAGATFASPAFAQTDEVSSAPSLSEKRPLVLTLKGEQITEASAAPIIVAQDNQRNSQPILLAAAAPEQVLVTSRRVEERAQRVPLPLSVVGSYQLSQSAAFNVDRLKEQLPTVQFYSSNPRNSAINIRGLGAPFGLTNDGIEPGVGLYIDGVYHVRSAAATFDFIDVEQIEVLRGPQGTLYGKNTTAGAINITTRRPSFTPESDFELSYGNYGFVQARASVTGALTGKIAGRLSLSGTQRDGVIYNVRTQDDVNDLNNLGARGQILFQANENLSILFAADYTRQRPEGYAQVVAGVAPTLRPANRQYAQIAADLGYTPPSFNAFDRLTDTDTPWRSNQNMGGVSLTVDWHVGAGDFTSITAWRLWDWNPSNDRDFLGLPITTLSQAPSKQRQWTQEFRYAGAISESVKFLVGAFGFHQTLASDKFHVQEQGSAAARFLLAPSANAATPGLLDGYGQRVGIDFKNDSAAVFGNVEWAVTDKLRVIPGIRLNYDSKKADYDAQIYGGLQTTNASLIALQRSILAPQAYKVDVNDTNVSGQLTLAYAFTEQYNAYATYSTGFKSVGVNLGGVPTDAAGNPILSAASVKPEQVRHFEVGLKTEPLPGAIVNFSVFRTDIDDFQTQVVNAQVGVLRGYLANAKQVRVQGIELDSNARIGDNFMLYASGAYSEGLYISFPDAPPQLELTGGPQTVDVSGSRIPGLSKWAASFGGEYLQPGDFLGRTGEFYLGTDISYRSSFSASPSVSQYMDIAGYGLVNARLGFRSFENWDVSFWVRNLFDKDYFELLQAAAGGSGLIVGLPGMPRTFGVTLRSRF